MAVTMVQNAFAIELFYAELSHDVRKCMSPSGGIECNVQLLLSIAGSHCTLKMHRQQHPQLTHAATHLTTSLPQSGLGATAAAAAAAALSCFIL